MAPINQRVASRVKGLLAEQGITNDDFFLAVGFSDRTGARRLAGTSAWTTDELATTAHVLGVSLSALVADRASQTDAA